MMEVTAVAVVVAQVATQVLAEQGTHLTTMALLERLVVARRVVAQAAHLYA